MSENGGWNFDGEDWQDVEAMQVADDELALMRGNYAEVAFDPRKVLITHNQGPVGSCRGHSGSTILEWIHALQTRNLPTVSLSPAFMYIRTQKKDGLLGRDVGSTVMGGVWVMENEGCCESELWPYVARYSSRLPSNWDACKENAKQFRTQKHVRLTGYEAIRTFLGSGQGGVDAGIRWSSKYSQPVVESYGGGGGGHAIAFPALSERMDRQGRPYVWKLNSHGTRSGVDGWTEWAPDAVEKACRDSRRNVFVGVSDMPAIQPREFDLDTWKSKLRVC